MNHTPTPWRVDRVSGKCAILGPDLKTKKKVGVDTLQVVTWMEPNHTTDHNANAAHIVRCVNERKTVLKIINAFLVVCDDQAEYLNQAKHSATGLGLYDLAVKILKEAREEEE